MGNILTVNYEKKPCYDICIEDSFDTLAEKIKELGFEGRKIAIITDTNVGPLYAEEIKKLLAQIKLLFTRSRPEKKIRIWLK